MKPLILTIWLLLLPQVSAPPEIVKLKRDYVRATEEYKESLSKLLPFYEADIKRAEEKLALTKQHVSDGLASQAQIDDHQRNLERARQKIEETKRSMTLADEQIASLPSDEELIKQYKRDRAAEAASAAKAGAKRSKRCSNWTLTAKQHTTARSVSFSYVFVCQN